MAWSPPELLADGAGTGAGLARTLRFAVAGPVEGVLQVSVAAAACDDGDGVFAACHRYQQDWGVPGAAGFADAPDDAVLALRAVDADVGSPADRGPPREPPDGGVGPPEGAASAHVCDPPMLNGITAEEWLAQDVDDLLDQGSVGLYEFVWGLNGSSYTLSPHETLDLSRRVARRLLDAGRAEIFAVTWPGLHIVDGPLPISVLDDPASWSEGESGTLMALVPTDPGTMR